MTKKILSMALAIAMVMALSVTAFAQDVALDPSQGTGSITIENASKGETYTVYKLFNATVNAAGTAVAYTGDIPSTMTSFFEKDAANNIHATEAAWNGEKMSEELEAALTAWAESATALNTAESNGSELTFSALPFGYYVVTTSQGNQLISVDSTMPNAKIVDKNSTQPTLTKVVDDEEVQINDTVTYTVTFKTSNFHGAGEEAIQVEEYVLHDDLPSFLTDVIVTSITIDGVAYEEEVTEFTNNKIVLPWAEKGVNLYKNGAVVVVTYTATVTADVITNGTNTATLTWTGEKEGLTDTAVIKTYAVDIVKIDGNTREELTGAEFYLLDANGGIINVVKTEDGVYRVAMTGENEIVKIEAGKATVQGLDSDVGYQLKETKAPNGYNVLTENVEFKCVANTVLGDVPSNIAIEVENFAGTELPSTGGIGTTIFYALGAVMVIGAGVLLVAKKRMSIEG